VESKGGQEGPRRAKITLLKLCVFFEKMKGGPRRAKKGQKNTLILYVFFIVIIIFLFENQKKTHNIIM
jgi:hypothetical protein